MVGFPVQNGKFYKGFNNFFNLYHHLAYSRLNLKFLKVEGMSIDNNTTNCGYKLDLSSFYSLLKLEKQKHFFKF